MLEKIKLAVEQAKNFPNPVIEYNFELPKHREVRPDSFFGVKALYNSKVGEDAFNITYKFG